MGEKGITVTYLAKIAGVSTQMVSKDVKMLKAMLEVDESKEVKL